MCGSTFWGFQPDFTQISQHNYISTILYNHGEYGHNIVYHVVHNHRVPPVFFLQWRGALLVAASLHAQDVAAFRAILSDHGNRERNPEENPLLKWWGDLDILFLSVKLNQEQVDFPWWLRRWWQWWCSRSGLGGWPFRKEVIDQFFP